MSINLQITGACKECPYIDLELDYHYIADLKSYRLKCTHAAMCYHMQEEAEKESEGDRI